MRLPPWPDPLSRAGCMSTPPRDANIAPGPVWAMLSPIGRMGREPYWLCFILIWLVFGIAIRVWWLSAVETPTPESLMAGGIYRNQSPVPGAVFCAAMVRARSGHQALAGRGAEWISGAADLRTLRQSDHADLPGGGPEPDGAQPARPAAEQLLAQELTGPPARHHPRDFS